MQAGAGVTGLVGGYKPLAIAINTMVIGAAFTFCTAGAGGLGGMQAVSWRALRMGTKGLSVNTGAPGARTLWTPL